MLLSFVSWTAGLAQATGTLQGTVTDVSGAVIPGAQVLATQLQTGTTRSTVSSSAYALPSLQPGSYRLVVSAPGMQATTLDNIPTAGCLFSSNGTQFGDSQRNLVYGPGFEDVDLSLDKKTTILERYTIDIKVDAFNVLNHPNFGQPINQFAVTPTSVSAGLFGEISSTRFPSGDVGSSRQLQLSGKFIF
jgi:hypothetical protein